MSNDVKLELCPFCGGPAQIIAGAPGCYYVRCEGCSVTSDDGSRERVITKWNTRHQPQWPQRLTELVADLETWEPHMIEALRATEPAKKLATALKTTPAPAEDDDPDDHLGGKTEHGGSK